MGVTLTATTSRTVIDLTVDSQPLSQAPISTLASWKRLDSPAGHERGVQVQSPPAKRRRVDNGGLVKRRDLRQCLVAQVFPHLNQAAGGLSPDSFRTDGIAQEALSTLVKSTWFRTRLDETYGYLTAQDENKVKAELAKAVARLVKLPAYHLHRTKIPSTIKEPIHKTEVLPQKSFKNPHAISITPHATTPSSREARSAALAQANAYKSWNGTAGPVRTSKWLQLNRRPYITAADRRLIHEGTKRPTDFSPDDFQGSVVYHVGFNQDEVAQLSRCVTKSLHDAPSDTRSSTKSLFENHDIPSIVEDQFKGRTAEDIRNFCSDLRSGLTAVPRDSLVISLERGAERELDRRRRISRVEEILLARELEGNKGFGRTRYLINFQNELKKAREDGLGLVAEFTNCAGDIATVSWTSQDAFITGTTAHSDSHNQQYNKPGNLLLCSTKQGSLQAFADHRIPRPVVEKGENSTEAMRQSQDPWLYSSVVSSDYDAICGRAYTSSFDKTVKIWKVDGQAMTALATWQHDGNVNFVAAAKDGSGRVASAADVPSDAVRIYNVNDEDIGNSTFQAFSCSRPTASEKWAYYPATMQWGRAPGTTHLLVVGYSPRSCLGDDHDIPEDKKNSGEITLWDADQGLRLPVMTATTQNVFEVAWHPTLHRFIVATSPCGQMVDHRVKTQIHVFQRDRDRMDGAYTEFQSLDCFASDINELSIMPNSLLHAYVTAACTDGKVYVWDTAQGDKPKHILKHGLPLDELMYEDREKEDTGVKFTAWGTSPDRFYTGASDGLVKVWNVRHKTRPYVRDLLEAPGPISCGAFSPDQSRLAIGDATGRVFLLSVDERDVPEAHFVTLPGSTARVRRPRPFVPHPEPPAPKTDADSMDTSEDSVTILARRTFLESKQLIIHPSPVVGATKGPEYSSSGLFRKDAHLDDDPAGPLLPEYERLQQESIACSRGARRRSLRRIREVGPPGEQLERTHRVNRARDLRIEELGDEVVAELVRAGAELHIDDEEWGFDYEEIPDL